MKRKLMAGTPTVFSSSAGLGETLETAGLPIVGASRRRAFGPVFWRRYALVLTGYFVVRIVLDLAGLAG